MIVTCPDCKAEYNIPDEKIGTQRMKATCKKCVGEIIIEPPLTAEKIVEEVVVADAMENEAVQSVAQVAEDDAARAVREHYPQYHGLLEERIIFTEVLDANKKGSYTTRQNGFKLKILQAVYGKLSQILLPDEQVYRVGQGFAYYPTELFFGNGFLTLMYNNYAILCTNKRILFCNITYRNAKTTHLFFQMQYEELTKVKRGLLGRNLVFLRKKGKKRVFQYMKGYASKGIKEFIDAKVVETASGAETGEFLEHLCPSCFVPLKAGLENCPDCNALFKRPAQAMIRSFLLPGLGDLYLGHRSLGSIELLGSMFIWFIVISMLLSGEEGVLVIAMLIVIFYNGADALFTWFMGRKGYMLA